MSFNDYSGPALCHLSQLYVRTPCNCTTAIVHPVPPSPLGCDKCARASGSIACQRRAPATAFPRNTHIGSLHLGCEPYAYITIYTNPLAAAAMQHSYIPPRHSVRAAACIHGEGPPAIVRLLLCTESRPLPSLRPMRPGLQSAAQADDMRPRRPLDAIKC